MVEFLIALLAAAGATLTGRSLLFLFDRVFGTRNTRRPAAEVWGMSILMGVSFTSASGFVWSDMGQELGPHYSWRQAIIGGLLGILAEFRSRRLTANAPPPPVVQLTPVQIRNHWAFRVIVCVAVVGASVLTLQNTSPPDKVRRTIEEKARIVFETRTIDAPALVHPEVVLSSSRDPLMLPLFERHVYALLGRESQPWARIWSPLTYAGLLLSFIGVVGRRIHPNWGWGIAVALIQFLWIDHGGLHVSDALPTLPAACFHGVAVLYLWDALHCAPGRERVRGILLASGMASSVCFIRNDGVALLTVECLSWGLAVWLSQLGSSRDPLVEPPKISTGRNLLAIVYFALFAAVLLTPWMTYRSALPSPVETVEVATPASPATTNSTEFPTPERGIVTVLLNYSAWPALVWLLIGFVPIAWKSVVSRTSIQFLGINLLCSFAALLALEFVASEKLRVLLGHIDSNSYALLAPVELLLLANLFKPEPITEAPQP